MQARGRSSPLASGTPMLVHPFIGPIVTAFRVVKYLADVIEIRFRKSFGTSSGREQRMAFMRGQLQAASKAKFRWVS